MKLPTLLAILILSLPTLVTAAGLVPCGGTGEAPCQACHLVQMGQNLLTWFITIMASVIALIFAINGMKLVMARDNSHALSEAKGSMTNAIVGFVILLSAWLIVDTVLKTVIDDSKLGVWNKIACVAQPEPIASDTPTPVKPGTATTTAECTDDAGLKAKYGGSDVGVEAPGLRTMIGCYTNDAAVAAALDSSQIYTVDRSNPRCSLTNGNQVCGSCSHSANSCHYGRGSGKGAMGVDFNAKSGFSESELYKRLQARNGVCGGRLNFESNHTHISMPGC